MITLIYLYIIIEILQYSLYFIYFLFNIYNTRKKNNLLMSYYLSIYLNIIDIIVCLKFNVHDQQDNDKKYL